MFEFILRLNRMNYDLSYRSLKCITKVTHYSLIYLLLLNLEFRKSKFAVRCLYYLE